LLAPIITNEAERDQHLLEHRHRQSGGQRAADQQRDGDRAGQAHHQLRDQLATRRNALGVAPRELEVVVDEPHRAIAERQQQHGPDEAVAQIRPQQRRDRQRQQDQQAAHRRRALLLDQVPLGPVLADRLPAALHRAQPADHHRPEHEAEEQRGQAGGPRAEGEIAEEVRDHVMIGERSGEVVEH